MRVDPIHMVLGTYLQYDVPTLLDLPGQTTSTVSTDFILIVLMFVFVESLDYTGGV